jgi:hypothetical protein
VLDLVDITLANLDTFLQKMYPAKAAKPGRQIKEKMYVPLTLKKLPLNFNVYINEKDEYIIQKVQNNTAYIVPGMVTPVFIHPRFLVDINADRISVLDIDSMSLSSINLPFLPDRSEIYPSDIRHGGDFLVRSYKLITSNHMHLYHFYTVSVGAGANITLSSIPLSTDMNAHILSSGYIDDIPTYADGGPPDQFGILPYLNGAYMYMSGSMRPKVIHVPDSLRGLIHEPIPLVPLEIFPTAIKSDNDLLNLYSDAAKGIYKDVSPFSPNFRIVWWLVPLVVLGGGMYGIIWRRSSQPSRTEIESMLRK